MCGNKLREVVIIIMLMIMKMETNECCIESERNALLEIKSFFNPNSTYLSSWGASSGDDCCNWELVECNSTTGHITTIDLSYIRDIDYHDEDNWYLNASLFLPFQQLNQLYLRFNSIAGCIQNQDFDRLSTLANLEILDLYTNKFNNTILRSLSSLHSLKSLDLSRNELKGIIDISGFERLSTLANLESLDLSGNKFNNTILRSLNGFKALKFLKLEENELKGTINISELSNLTSALEELYLGSNKIEGFESMEALAHLEILDLSFNNFNNTILRSLSRLQALTSLDLGYNNFHGTIDISELDGLTNLVELDFFNNKITNFIVSKGLNKLEELNLDENQFNETTTTDFLQSIGRITSLKTLTLEVCGLSGKIPTNSLGLCNLKNLEDLRMNNNDLNGNLPPCLGNMSSLQSLYISDNRLSIPISLSPFFNLSQLKNLAVSNNSIYEDTKHQNLIPKFQLERLYMGGYGEGGELPKFLYHQHSLEAMSISSLKLRGGFPYWLLENNTRLYDLELFNNSLSGPIRSPNHPHVNMIYLSISDNFFDGSIPSNIGILFPNLEELRMSGNELKGSIPNSLCNMSALSFLDLSNNYISGSVPSNFSPSSLEVVNLSKNKLQGSLKDKFYSSTVLFQLDLSHNNFSGTIPSWIGKLSELTFLVLRYNNLQGKIPIELCNLKKLSFLDLSHNKIVGHMIPCLTFINIWGGNHSKFPNIQDIEITTKGQTYIYEQNVLSYLSGIDISCNYITGNIPVEIGNLSRIEVLNFSRNSFTGKIPPTFSNLNKIESLDLSLNNLQGTIPTQLTQLTSLSVFNVSYNNLSGPIPNAVNQFGTFNESSYKGNSFLCGWPLPKSCSTSYSPPSNARILPNSDISRNRFIDMEDFFVSFGISYGMVLLTLAAILCINPYWRRVWFYYIQMSIDRIYYFVIDNDGRAMEASYVSVKELASRNSDILYLQLSTWS